MKNINHIVICSPCALNANGKSPAMASVSMNICDVCNRWKPVMAIRDFGYPNVECQRNKAIILSELEKTKSLYLNEGNIYAASVIEDMIVDQKLTM